MTRPRLTSGLGALRWGFIGIWSILTFVPLLILVLQSVSGLTAPANIVGLGSSRDFSNYRRAVVEGHLGQAYEGSIVVVGVSVIAAVILGSLAAYPLARRRNALYGAITFALVSSFVLPPALSIVPLYTEMRGLHLIGSYFSLILLYTASLFPWSTFMYLGFIRALPIELEEAARVDGASRLQVYFRIVLPLLRPVTASVAIILGLFIWNDFFNPFVFLTGAETTVARAVYELGNGSMSGLQVLVTPFPLVFAAIIVTTLPLVLLFFALQRQFVSGLTRGAIKG